MPDLHLSGSIQDGSSLSMSFMTAQKSSKVIGRSLVTLAWTSSRLDLLDERSSIRSMKYWPFCGLEAVVNIINTNCVSFIENLLTRHKSQEWLKFFIVVSRRVRTHHPLERCSAQPAKLTPCIILVCPRVSGKYTAIIFNVLIGCRAKIFKLIILEIEYPLNHQISEKNFKLWENWWWAKLLFKQLFRLLFY